MALIKAVDAKAYKKEIAKKASAPKTTEEIYKIIATSTLLGLKGKKIDKKTKSEVDAVRNKKLFIWHEQSKCWWLYISYGNVLAYAYDIKGEKNNKDAAVKLAQEYLANLAAGKISQAEKTEIERVIKLAVDKGKALSGGKNVATGKK